MNLRIRADAKSADEADYTTYDRVCVHAGIAHIGVGGFHRSHQAVYVDDLLRSGDAPDWGIVGIGLLPGDSRMRDVMEEQNCAYTLVLKFPDGRSQARVIGSIIEYHFAPADPAAVMQRLTDPHIRIVSLTVTEGGYNINPTTGEFDALNPGVVHDLAHPATPQTVFGLVVEALRLRRAQGTAPFTVLSCDNLQSNGDVARTAFTAFAALRDPTLAAWMGEGVAFPNSMVDRITPQTTDEDRAEVATRWGIDDAWPVVAEPFRQWVIEDRFPTGRPPWERVGVQFVDDVAPFELMKLRLLNASHQAMAYVGILMGYTWVHDAASDPLITRLLRSYWTDEAIPSLPTVPGLDPYRYTETLIERYRNPAIRDTLTRLSVDASDRIPTFLLPVVRDQLAAGRDTRISAAVVASWARYVEVAHETGAAQEMVDVRKEKLMAMAATLDHEPMSFLEDRELFGDLARESTFVTGYLDALGLLRSKGAQAMLQRILEPSRPTPSPTASP